MSDKKQKTGNPTAAASSFRFSHKPWGDKPYTRERFISDLGKVAKKSGPPTKG